LRKDSTMAGRELTRQSSFERMMNLCNNDNNSSQQMEGASESRDNAAYEIQEWWRKERKFVETRVEINKASSHAAVAAGSLQLIGANRKVFQANPNPKPNPNPHPNPNPNPRPNFYTNSYSN
jgi:hypothetical protein